MSQAPDFPENPLKAGTAREYGAAPMQCEATRLMLAAKRGDKLAFDTLVESLRGRAFHVAKALVGSSDDAMELAQESFLKIYKARATFRDGEPFLPWFHRILRNTCFTHLRDQKRAKPMTDLEPAGADDDFDFEIVDDASGPAEASLSNERAHSFWVGFGKLAARDREILALRHFKELSYKDIASGLGIPEGTVMSRLFHARRRLRDALDPSVFDPDERLPTQRGPG